MPLRSPAVDIDLVQEVVRPSTTSSNGKPAFHHGLSLAMDETVNGNKPALRSARRLPQQQFQQQQEPSRRLDSVAPQQQQTEEPQQPIVEQPYHQIDLAQLRKESDRYLEVVTDQLLDRLFVALSTLPENNVDADNTTSAGTTDRDAVPSRSTSFSVEKKQQNTIERSGLSIPACAVAWIASQLFYCRLDHHHSCQEENDQSIQPEQQDINSAFCSIYDSQDTVHCPVSYSSSLLCTLSSSIRSRLALLPFLLCRVTHVRITSEHWPPSPPEGGEWSPELLLLYQQYSTSTSSTSWSTLIAAVAVASNHNDEANASTSSLSLVNGVNDSIAYWCHFLNWIHQPRVDLRVFPNCRVLHLYRVPIEWIIPSSATRHCLEVLRVEGSCIFDLNHVLQTWAKGNNMEGTIASSSSSHQEKQCQEQGGVATLIDPLASSTGQRTASGCFPKLRHLRLSRCCLNNGSGLQGKRVRRRRVQEHLDEVLIMNPPNKQDSWTNQAPGLSPFVHLPQLKSLCLSHNEISSECVIGHALYRSMLCLESIDLSHNRIVSFHNSYRWFGNIQTLLLSHNEIVSVDGIDRLYGLETLWLDHNRISEIGQVSGLARLPLLQSLRLAGNPLEHLHRKSYRIGILDLFKERRLTELPKNATYRQLQQALPVLDDQVAKWEELVALRQRTFVSTVVHHVTPMPTIALRDQLLWEVASKDNIRKINNGNVHVRRRRRNVHIIEPGHRSFVDERPIGHTLTTEAVLPMIAFSLDDVLLSLSDPKVWGKELSCLSEECEHNRLGDIPVENGQAHEENVADASHELVNDDFYYETEVSTPNHTQIPPETLTDSYRHDDSDISLPTQVHDYENEAAEAAFGQLNQSPIRPGEGESQMNYSCVNIEAHAEKAELVSADKDPDTVILDNKPVDDRSDKSQSLGSPPASGRIALRVVSFPDNVWTEDPTPGLPSLVSVSSSPQYDEATCARMFKLAEENSAFDGPPIFKDLTIADNLDLYFRLFVFGKVNDESVRSQVDDNDSDAWREMMVQYPRVQLWPIDRRLRETLRQQRAHSSTTALGSKPCTREEFKCLWKERVVACGRSALRRLTPCRAARYGFHGELLWSAATTTHLQPETVAECRELILCCSDAALYFIVDHDSVTQKTKDVSRNFPIPMPEGGIFKDAKWPHCLARHPFETLRGITIGFGFQRITLHFSNVSQVKDISPDSDADAVPSAKANVDFSYVLLTSNKLETIKLLKLFQHIAQECRESFGEALVAALRQNAVDEAIISIDNDDRHVLDALGVAVAPDIIGVVLHYQILQQRWRSGDRGTVRRVCVVTDAKLFLLDEDYVGDGSSQSPQTNGSISSRPSGEVSYRLVDSAALTQVKEVHAADVDPKAITIVIRPVSKFQRTHNWRLLCRDGVGAERLVDDVRKAASLLLTR